MASYAEERNRRKKALQKVRKEERELDTRLERLERVLLRLLDRKTILTSASATQLVRQFDPIAAQISTVERTIRDFIAILVD